MTKYHKKRYSYFRVLYTYLVLIACLTACEGGDNAGNQSDPQIPDSGRGVEENKKGLDKKSPEVIKQDETKTDSVAKPSLREEARKLESAVAVNGAKNKADLAAKPSLREEARKSEGFSHSENENKVLPKAIRLKKATVSLAEENEDSHLLELTFVYNKLSIKDGLYILPKGTKIRLKHAEEEVLTIELATDQQLVDLKSGDDAPAYGFTHQVFIKKHELNKGPYSEGNLLIDLLEYNNPTESVTDRIALTGMWSKIGFNLLDLKTGKAEQHQFNSASKAEYITKLLKLKEDVNSLDGLPQAGILYLFYLMQSVGVNIIVEMPTGERVENTSQQIGFKWLK